MKNFVLLFLTLPIFFWSCSKEEQTNENNFIKFKIYGWYLRDTTIKTDGLKGVNFSETGDYCWTSIINSLDSTRCYGTFIQTSDSTLQWSTSGKVEFKLTIIDSTAKLASMQMSTQPPSYPLHGKYR